MTDDQKAPPAKEDKAPDTKAPDTTGKAEDKKDTLPEKFKGKSAEEIAKSYIELEKKIGDQGKEVEDTRKEISQWKALGQVISESPDIKSALEKEIAKRSGKKTEDDKKEEKKEDKLKRDDTRIAMEDQIINKFETDRGIDTLPKEKKSDLDKAIGRELVDMLDPTGTKSPSEIIASIPVNRLPNYLEKAYKLATADDKEERTRSQEFVEARRNREATIGSISSSGVKTSDIELTQSEREAARRMHVTEEQYKKNKAAILKGE